MSNTYDYNNAFIKIAEVTGSRKRNKLNYIPWEQFKNIADFIHMDSNQHVLDTGCGIGGIAKYYAQNYGVKVTAVDASTNMIEYAKENNSHPLVTYTIGSFPAVLPKLETYDIILSILWLADVSEDRHSVLKGLVSKLSNNGYFIVADWLRTDESSNVLVDELCKGWKQNMYMSLDGFKNKLEQTGLKIIKEIDLHNDLIDHLRNIHENLVNHKAELYGSVDKKIIDDQISIIELTKNCAEQNLVCAPILICKKL